MTMNVNVNALVCGIGSSLQKFFEFCEEEEGVKASVMDDLFNRFFGSEAKPKAKKTKKPKKSKAQVHSLSDSDDSDNETSVITTPKARKPSPGKKDLKPRDEQTPLPADLNKKKLNELKVYLKERGLPVSGNKAQLIENLLAYEKEQEDAPPQPEPETEEEDPIQVKKPKPKGKKLCEPATKMKYTIEKRHGHNMIQTHDGCFVLNDEDIVIGWVNTDDMIDIDEDESVNMQALRKEQCEIVKGFNLEYEVPENLDD